ncbi:MAG: transposase [Ignavibacteriales bacterium]|nr:transposase [Ignavibacteriales bacterium]
MASNHFHFLLRQTSDANLGECIQKIFLSYTKAFNKMYDRSGTLFEDRFKAIHVKEEGYILHLCRYIHRNPLEAYLVKDISKWEFSNYLEWINNRRGNLVDREFIEERFSNPIEYEQFVLNYNPPDKIQKGLKKYFFE